MDQVQEFFEKAGTEQRRAPRSQDLAAEVTGRAPDSPPHVDKGLGVGSRSWAEADGVFWGTASSHARLPSGLYRMDVSPNVGPVFMAQKNDTDELVAMPDSESQKILDEIRIFKDLEPSFRKHGFLYKRGILMFGPPGSGKTCTLQLLVRLLREEHDSIAVVVERPSTAGTCLQALRRIEPKRQIVAIMEDLDALVERYGESEYLALLDGESQVDSIVFVATTNYPERLDRRFVDRPSRFDTIRYIGMPSPAGRRAYLDAKLDDVATDLIEQYVEASEGYSVAHLREMIILTRCFGVPLAEAKKRMDLTRGKKLQADKAPSADNFGFNRT